MTQEWISVKEQVPEDGRYVTATNGKISFPAWYDVIEKKWWHAGGGGTVFRATHWMPLPPPPEDAVRTALRGARSDIGTASFYAGTIPPTRANDDAIGRMMELLNRATAAIERAEKELDK
jgi:hypothetical protein